MNFAIIPVPYHDESQISYVLRLLKRNGLKRTKQLLSYSELGRIIKYQKSKIPVIDSLINNISQPKIQYDFVWRNNLLINCQICPACVHENGYLKTEWQNPFVRHCEKHGCLLISRCTQCDSSFEFDISLLDVKCNNSQCNSRQQLLPSHDFIETQSRVYDALLIANVIHEYPLQYSYYPPIQILEKDIIASVSLLTSQEAFKSFVKNEIEKHDAEIPLNFLFAKLHFLATRFQNNWPISETIYNLESVSFTRKAQPIQSIFIRCQDLLRLLHSKLSDLRKLKDYSLIVVKTEYQLNHKSVVNVAPLIKFLKKQKANSCRIPLKNLRQQRLLCDVSIVDIIIAIKQKKLTANFTSSNSIEDALLVNEQLFKQFSKNHFESIDENVISLESASKITGFDEATLLKLRRNGQFPAPIASAHENKEALLSATLKMRELKLKQLELKF